MHDDVLSMRFDQYQRYRLVADLLERVRADGERLRILDVGGRTALLRRFLDDEVWLLDVEPSQEPGLVLADGSRMPFPDDTFDVVAAFDTLEHVPLHLRQAFLAECARVARRFVLLAGPYEAPEVVEAELALQRFLSDKLDQHSDHLDQHRDIGLPVREEVEAGLTSLGCTVASLPHANLHRWLVGQCVSFYMDFDPTLADLAKAFHRAYNSELYPSDHAAPVYRHFVVAALPGATLPAFDGLLAPPMAPPGALDGFAGIASELSIFDRERDAWRNEREKLLTEKQRLGEALAGRERELEALRAERSARDAADARGLRGLVLRVLGQERRA